MGQCDLAAASLSEFPDLRYELKLTALDGTEKSICEDLYSTRDLLTKRATLDEAIWLANYMQVPVDKKGALYSAFKTYDVVDLDEADRLICYTDTADEGSDNLCSISAAVFGRYGYVTDVYYTDEAMEVTEPETARPPSEGEGPGVPDRVQQRRARFCPECHAPFENAALF